MGTEGSSLSPQRCKQHADECRLLAQEAGVWSVRVMLDHIAGTWDRIAEELANPEEN
jgi:hypothetical protein